MNVLLDHLYTIKTILESKASFKVIGSITAMADGDFIPVIGPLLCPENNLHSLPDHLQPQKPFLDGWAYWSYLLSLSHFALEEELSKKVQKQAHIKSSTLLAARKRALHVAGCAAEYSALEIQFPRKILTHLDLDVQNIYVDDNWQVTGN
jgi:hypothetical protein